MGKAAIWCSSAEFRTNVARFLVSAAYEVAGQEIWRDPSSEAFRSLDLAIIEWSGEIEEPGVRLARELRARGSAAQIIIVALRSSEELAIAALRVRADEYLKAPCDFARLAEVIGRRQDPMPTGSARLESMIVGDSPAMRLVRTYVARISATNSSVLITGETGTGKERVAQALHEGSARRHKPFVCVNCAAIPDTLLESELFGYDRGAFTGAVTSRDGKLKQANGGTLFFDEIGDMSLQAQAKILRAIESREICPLGSGRKLQLDVRYVAATNRDIDSLMREERFRLDLYYRINVGRIQLPPLRERPSDIPLLIHHFLPYFNRVFGRRVEGVRNSVLRELMAYSWPGNVRELRNVIEIMFVHLPPRALELADTHGQIAGLLRGPEGRPCDERDRVVSALLATNWNVSEAARKLHWSRMTLYRKLAKYDFARERHAAATRKATA